MIDRPASLAFVRDLHRALVHLYDPAGLRKSPLVDLFSIHGRENPAMALQRILLDAIEVLKPGATAPPQSSAWRVYRILFHRYTEQCTQVEAATTLALSERQLRREEHLALRLLAERLWTQFGLQLRTSLAGGPEAAAAEESRAVEAGTPSREQELAWLRESVPSEAASALEVVEAALRLVGPLLEALHVCADCALPENLPRLAAAGATLRQALLNVLAPAIRSAPGGEVRLRAEASGRMVILSVEPLSVHRTPSAASPDDVENLDMARQLVELCGGSLAVTPGEGPSPFTVRLALLAVEQAAVLAIDDNADTLRLFQRCLADTRYPFIGARDPEQALALAEHLAPRVIILDLMLPGLDGWEVLGRLREHPRTRGIPIVVCSILPQEQLALALGAAAFMRKPVSRAALLEVLDRLIGQRASRMH